MRHVDCTLAGTVFLALLAVGSTSGAPLASAADVAAPTAWRRDYGEALDEAAREGKMLVVLFQRPVPDLVDRHFESRVLGDLGIAGRLRRHVCVKLPVDAVIRVGGEEVKLLDDPVFAQMQGRPGVAMIDYAHPSAEYYGCVVGAFPLADDACYSVQQMTVILGLAPGDLDQRTRAYVEQMRKLACEPCGTACPADASGAEPAELAWRADYAAAHETARIEGRMLLVLFSRPEPDSLGRRFESEVLSEPAVRDKLQDYVLLKLPLDATVRRDGEEVEVLKEAAFAEMLGREGLAIVDFANKDKKYYGCVVSTFPFLRGGLYTAEQTRVMLTLPPGTLTQRTLIYAVRTHPERPASTDGQVDENLAEEAESHSDHQARIRLQGHHNWSTRFHRINRLLRGGLLAREVCAESWPGENLVEAAIECVRCWRLSSGHWSAVRARHQVFGYDMKRGDNGVWYATGIFGSRS